MVKVKPQCFLTVHFLDWIAEFQKMAYARNRLLLTLLLATAFSLWLWLRSLSTWHMLMNYSWKGSRETSGRGQSIRTMISWGLGAISFVSLIRNPQPSLWDDVFISCIWSKGKLEFLVSRNFSHFLTHSNIVGFLGNPLKRSINEQGEPECGFCSDVLVIARVLRAKSAALY